MLTFKLARAPLALSCLPLLSISASTWADAPLSSDPSVATQAATSLQEITVTAERLNEARAGIETQTGASTYTIDAAAIAATPGGDNTLLNQVILQVAGSRPGLLRAVSRPRRAQRPAVPPERHHPARGHQRVRPVARSAR